MKTILRFFFFLFAALFTFKLNAQCDLGVSIKPSHPTFCPGGTITLTTEKFHTYQWFKNGEAIAGATDSFLVITQAKDDNSFFRVVVSNKKGCLDTSRKVQTQSYTFDSLTVSLSGDIGILNKKGAYIECPNDTLILSIDSPYLRNIQWYNDFSPVKGAHSQSFDVTKRGSYTVCAAPDACADYLQCDSIPITVSFDNPTATITQKHDTLFASSAKKYQWYGNSQKIDGATQSFYVPDQEGIYKVVTQDASKCQAVSDPYHFIPGTGIVSVAPNPVKDVMRLHVDSKNAKQLIVVDLYGNQQLRANITGSDQMISLQNIKPGTYIVQLLNSGSRQIASITIIKE